jgi:hypothetical protein
MSEHTPDTGGGTIENTGVFKMRFTVDQGPPRPDESVDFASIRNQYWSWSTCPAPENRLRDSNSGTFALP